VSLVDGDRGVDPVSHVVSPRSLRISYPESLDQFLHSGESVSILFFKFKEEEVPVVHVLHVDVDRVFMSNVLGENVVQVFFDGSLMVVPERQDVLDDSLLRDGHLCESRHTPTE